MCGVDGSTAPALGALLAKHQIGLTVEEVLDELDSVFAAIPGATTLSTTEVDFLRTHAGPQAADLIDAWSADDERQARARVALGQLSRALSGSVSIKEAATILGIDRSRVSRRITGKALWAYDLQGSRRIPRWQFLGGELLPGLDVIVPAIPRGTTPAVLDAFMHTPQPDFDDRTPIEHLAAGGDPALVAGFIADLGRW
ncbi:helix-turn-helix domain-containing protein [uncultured Mycobacterium sp.]|uniref:helix-turn-helix domain-containing protein n=1 Tax=uncultured Mycobacterium sp. TaxID=171292 RepID=UPI0035C9D040